MRLTDYLLNSRTSEQTKAFAKGLQNVFPENYLSYFFPDEVELLISGGMNEIDIDDLKDNTVLNNFKPEENEEDRQYLENFWGHLKSLPNE